VQRERESLPAVSTRDCVRCEREAACRHRGPPAPAAPPPSLTAHRSPLAASH
jgi:hypothetical protein